MTDTMDSWATWREIHQQPQIWRDWGARLDVAGLRAWIAAQTFEEVWFCGAGTSAYIGEILVAGLPHARPPLRAVASTDLVAQPGLLRDRCPLVVSFGRSGNSAESLGTLDALDSLAPRAPRLHITCNPAGALATRAATGPLRVIALPEATHDAGFAMTSSFSTMLLTALALFDATGNANARFAQLADSLEQLLPNLRAPRPERMVYLGTGPLAFAAREAALKVMELSAGQIPALWDSTLGFRHGPKAFVIAGTAITLFTSGLDPARRYERDLLAELRAQFPEVATRSVGFGGDIDIDCEVPAVWSAPLCIAEAQVNAALWSADLGLDVDDPFRGQGTLSRVVSGVTLYPVVQ